MLAFTVLLAITFWLIYKFWSAYSYWKDRGFPFVPGHFPFGSSMELCTQSKFQGFILKEFHTQMESHPVYGIYAMRTPILIVKDPEIIRLVMTKDFSHFRDRLSVQRSAKEFMGHHLFNLEGDRWRPLRVKLSPTFTSGKIKSMLPLLLKCSENYGKMLTRLKTSVDIKDITSSFTLDTICSCAFGLEVNSLTDENSELKKISSTIFKKNYFAIVVRSLLQSFPSVAKKIPVRVVSDYIQAYLLDLITKTVEFRKESGLVRHDFLDILLELKEKETIGSDVKVDEKDISSMIEMTNEFLAAQCFVFLAAGFETSSSVQSFFLYEMALNPNIQERVHDEIVKVINDHGLTYQSIQDMKYLDMAIHEAMRKYPTVPVLTRCCTKAFDLPTGQTIEKGTIIWIPLYSLHHDPSNFPNPEVFDPERFSDENKSSIKPFTYLPFGEGPRLCIGLRFGLLQTKIGLISLLRDYRVERTSNTPVPLKFTGSSLLTTTDGRIELKISKRNDL